uniref:Transposase (Putative), gypsy type n=1 Tax=Tanacetum cinerariifolium TaxID=118510 RepID=A0A6L2L257_TANCI|nr:hypothetical protein [Tanacetum cinerariifolium]
MDLFAFIRHADLTKVRVSERQIKERQVSLLESSKGRVIPLNGANEQGAKNDNVEVTKPDNLNVEGGNAEHENRSEGDDHVGQDDNIVVDDDVQATVTNKPKGARKKRKVVGGASGSNLPPKKLREDHDTSDDPVLVPLGNPRALGTNAADAEVTSIVKSPILPPHVMTAAIATTAVAGISSAPVLGAIYVPKWNVINDSTLDDPEVCRSMIDQLALLEFFSQLHGMDYDQLFAEFNVRAARQTCFSAEVRLWSEHNFRERKKFKRKCNSLKERNLALEGEKSTLEGQVMMLESVAASKDSELASVNTQVAKLNHDLSSLQLSFDELSTKAAILKSERHNLTDQYEAVQDEQVKILSYRVAELDSKLMGMALHLDEEFYPRFLTTIAGQSMQTGLVAGIDHRKARRGLAEVAAYDPSVEESITDIMDSFRLEGPSAETLKVKEGALSHRLSISKAMSPLLYPLSSENLVGEASTSRVPATVATTTALSILATTTNVSSIPPISVDDYEVLHAEPQAEASYSPKITFEQETLETSPEHRTTN